MPRVREREDSKDSVSITIEDVKDENSDEDECKGVPVPSGDCGAEKSSGPGQGKQDGNDDDDDDNFKDTTPGRRGRSAYAFYASDASVHEAIQSDNPDKSLAAIRELMRVQWEQMDEAARQPYDDQSISDHHIRKAFEEFDEVRSLLRWCDRVCVWCGVWCVCVQVWLVSFTYGGARGASHRCMDLRGRMRGGAINRRMCRSRYSRTTPFVSIANPL